MDLCEQAAPLLRTLSRCPLSVRPRPQSRRLHGLQPAVRQRGGVGGAPARQQRSKWWAAARRVWELGRREEMLANGPPSVDRELDVAERRRRRVGEWEAVQQLLFAGAARPVPGTSCGFAAGGVVGEGSWAPSPAANPPCRTSRCSWDGRGRKPQHLDRRAAWQEAGVAADYCRAARTMWAPLSLAPRPPPSA